MGEGCHFQQLRPLDPLRAQSIRCAYLSLRDTAWPAATAIHGFFQASSRGSTHFLPTAVKSKQKGPLSSKALTPIIDQIMQAAFSRSRRRKAQLAVSITAPCVILPSNIHVGRLPIHQQNLVNNRRALSREKSKSTASLLKKMA